MDHYLKCGETEDDLLIWDTEIHKMHSIFVTWPLQKFSPCKRIQDSLGFQVLDSGIFVSGTWIPDSSRKWDSDSLRNTLDYKALDSGFHKQKFPGFQKPENPDSLQWSEWACETIHRLLLWQRRWISWQCEYHPFGPSVSAMDFSMPSPSFADSWRCWWSEWLQHVS